MFPRVSLARRQLMIVGIALLAIIFLWRPIASLANTATTILNEDVYLPLIIQSYTTTQSDQYAVIGWNDLGMHCYNRDFQDIAVLPPFNTLWAQVIKVGDPPQIVTSGIKGLDPVIIEYMGSLGDNSYIRIHFLDHPSGFQSRHAGKSQVHQYDIRMATLAD